MIEWRIYYGDGSTFSSEDGTPFDAPGRNVQAIVIPDDELGRLVVSRWDFYYFKETWYGCDIFGLWDYLSEPGQKTVKFGRTLTNEEYREILSKATNDPDFTPKSAWSPTERKA